MPPVWVGSKGRCHIGASKTVRLVFILNGTVKFNDVYSFLGMESWPAGIHSIRVLGVTRGEEL